MTEEQMVDGQVVKGQVIDVLPHILSESFDDAQPWERIPGEGMKAYSSFIVYRDMGVARNLGHVEDVWREQNHLRPRNKPGLTGTVAQWSTRFYWRERALAWDSWQQRLKDAQWEKRIQELSEREWKASTKLFEIGLDGLDKLETDTLTPANIMRALELAMQIGEKTRPEPMSKDAVKQFLLALPEQLRMRIIGLLKGGESQ